MHKCHKDHLEGIRVDIVPFDLKMQQIGVILGDELSKSLSSFSTKNKIVEDEALCSSLINDKFLNILSLIYVHLNKCLEIISVNYYLITYSSIFK